MCQGILPNLIHGEKNVMQKGGTVLRVVSKILGAQICL